MEFIVGFLIWLAIGLVAGWAARAMYAAEATTRALTLVFGVCGAFIGGMLGMSAHVFHDPVPLRPGGVVGALLGSVFFAFLYHLVARKAL